MGSRSGFDADLDLNELLNVVDRGSGAVSAAQRQANAVANLGITASIALLNGVGGLDATAATLALTAAQAGSVVYLDKSAGTTVTLPVPVLGMRFTFVIKTTSTANKIITDSASTFLEGGLFIDKSLTITRYDGNGSSHVSLNFNGTTTGGITGDRFDLVAVSGTEWNVSGTVAASGTLATPFGTS